LTKINEKLTSAKIYIKKRIKQERQCTHDVTLRLIRVTVVAWKRNNCYIFWVCNCSLNYSARKANAQYSILTCSVSGFTIFFHVIS